MRTWIVIALGVLQFSCLEEPELLGDPEPDLGTPVDIGVDGADQPIPDDSVPDDSAPDTSFDMVLDGPMPDMPDMNIPPIVHSSPLGTNLGSVVDWAPSWPFVDVFKTSRQWHSGTVDEWEDGNPLDLDEDGWVLSLQPGQIARTLMLWAGDHFPEGDYVVLYDGVGRLEYEMGAVRDDEASTPGRDVVTFDTSNEGFVMNLVATDPMDPVRNIRVIMPGGSCALAGLKYCDEQTPCEAGACVFFEDNYETQIFHPDFLASLTRYQVLRFMDWIETNNSEIASWADRPQLTDSRWSTHGVPIEIIIALANRLSVDVWINIPHLADDDYVRQTAATINELLQPGLKVYVEYSNEVWNDGFAQAPYAKAQGLEAGFSENEFQAQLFFYSHRSVEVFDLFEGVLGAERLVRVMAAQAGNSWTSEQVLDFQGALAKTDALAIAPYISNPGTPEREAQVEVLTLDEFFDDLFMSLPETVGWIPANAMVAADRGIPLISYEGGQHLVGVAGVENNEAINTLFDAANRDPRMGVLYTDYLNAWREVGGTLFVHFTHIETPSKWGRWGSLEYQGQPRAEAPKFDALMRFIEANPIWW